MEIAVAFVTHSLEWNQQTDIKHKGTYMKPIVIMIVAVLVLSLAVYGCKGKTDQASSTKVEAAGEATGESVSGYQPAKQLIIDEFQQVWFGIHGAKGEKGNNWLLVKSEVGAIRADEAAKTATVSIKFTYKPGTKAQRTKTADFLFHELGGSWTIDKDTAKYPISE